MKKIKITESLVRKIVKESLMELMDDNGNEYPERDYFKPSHEFDMDNDEKEILVLETNDEKKYLQRFYG